MLAASALIAAAVACGGDDDDGVPELAGSPIPTAVRSATATPSCVPERFLEPGPDLLVLPLPPDFRIDRYSTQGPFTVSGVVDPPADPGGRLPHQVVQDSFIERLEFTGWDVQPSGARFEFTHGDGRRGTFSVQPPEPFCGNVVRLTVTLHWVNNATATPQP